MRLADIFQDLLEATMPRPVRTVVATKAFSKAFEAQNDWVQGVVRDFIKHKQADMGVPFGSKDSLLGGPRAKGFWRCHLVQGRIVLLYKPEPNGVLALYDIVPHTAIEGGTWSRVADALNNTPTDEYTVPTESEPDGALSTEVKSDVEQLLWSMAATDVPILRKATAGDYADLKEYVVLACHMYDGLASIEPDVMFEMVIKAFGGEEEFKANIAGKLNSINPR